MFYKSEYCLGVGVNYRGEISKEIINHINEFDFIEVNTERLFLSVSDDLNHVMGELPVVLHGLGLSLGSMEREIPSSYLSKVYSAIHKSNCEWFSEHLATTQVDEMPTRFLMPVAFNEASLERVIDKTAQIMSLSEKPFLLENIAYYYPMPESTISESKFINEVVRQTDCGILLDLTNLYVNSVNHQYDPYLFINELPLENVVEVHLAGCDYIHNTLVDTHASEVRQDVLALFEYLCKRTIINGVVIERDDRLNHFNELIDEVKLVRGIMKQYRLIR